MEYVMENAVLKVLTFPITHPLLPISIYQDPPGRMSPQWSHGVSPSGFQPPSQRSSFGQQDDDVDLEALLNDMACSGSSSVDTGSPAEPVLLPPCGPWRGDSQASSREASPRHAIHRSQPVHIHVSKNVCFRMPLAGRGGDDDMKAASLPSIPNPFPELCTPSCSPDLVGMSFPSHELVESHVSGFVYAPYRQYYSSLLPPVFTILFLQHCTGWGIPPPTHTHTHTHT
uniref:Uncharacterized protein n=1 Tax=Eptatretus burgeri TaxID=7764 RepID=A0A8C4NNR2_EPTBU